MAAHDDASSIGFGIIGCAAMTSKFCRAVSFLSLAKVTVRAVGSRSLDKAKEFTKRNRLPPSVMVYGSYEQVLEDDGVDAVYLPLPTRLHLEWAVLAAERKKHVLLEKPVAVDVAELDLILEACRSNGVQFMDGTMWLHHPRTRKIEDIMSDPHHFGQLDLVHSTSTFAANKEFFENNIRVKPELDVLGALGDLGWYSIGAILWAAGYKLPSSVKALPDVVRNSAGVILSCSATLYWEKPQQEGGNKQPITIATFHCSFLASLSMDLEIIGSNGSVRVKDLAIPVDEDTASIEFTPRAKFAELHIGWDTKPEKVSVPTELPQEALMIREFTDIVRRAKISNGEDRAESKWPEISPKTQVVLDSVKRSIDNGCTTVHTLNV
ncbi:hypothetical protein MLD38_001582 [Melastoma candidum]|nr:hypothetical protein MLD38_001582 [Melastoma candidum]